MKKVLMNVINLLIYILQWEDDIIGLEGLMEDMDDFEMDIVFFFSLFFNFLI